MCPSLCRRGSTPPRGGNAPEPGPQLGKGRSAGNGTGTGGTGTGGGEREGTGPGGERSGPGQCHPGSPLRSGPGQLRPGSPLRSDSGRCRDGDGGEERGRNGEWRSVGNGRRNGKERVRGGERSASGRCFFPRPRLPGKVRRRTPRPGKSVRVFSVRGFSRRRSISLSLSLRLSLSRSVGKA